MGAESIPLMYQGLQLNDPLEQYGKRAALSHMAAQGRLMDSQIAEKEQANTLSQMRQQALAGSGGDLDKARVSLMNLGDHAGAMDIQKHQLDTQKSQADLRSTQVKTSAEQMKHAADIAGFMADGGTMAHVKMGIGMLNSIGRPDLAKHMEDVAGQFPNATPEQIRGYIQNVAMPYISSQLTPEQRLMPKMQSTGGALTDTNPFSGAAPIPITQSPDSLASNKVAREGHQVTIRGQNMRQEMDSKTETRLSTAQQRLDQQNAQAASGAEGSKALIARMKELVTANPRSTATPLAGPARFAESMGGVFDPTAQKGPAIEFSQLRDTLLATVEGLRKDGRMSNQDRQRLENAVGAGGMTTPANTLESLKTVEEIIDRMSGGSKPSGTDDYAARRKKLLGY